MYDGVPTSRLDLGEARFVPCSRATPKSMTLSTVGIEQQRARRLDVAVDHALLVRGGQRLRQLAGDVSVGATPSRPRVSSSERTVMSSTTIVR